MELVNALHAFAALAADRMPAGERDALLREGIDTVLLLLGPFCPHVTEELWQALGHRDSLFRQRWPEADPAALVRDEVTVVVQIDGKVRSRLTVDVAANEADVRRLALDDDKVKPWLGGRDVDKVVVVPRRLVNIVTRS
jgi:leucyl-tRNA synthetase